jgi:hypothetical protein
VVSASAATPANAYTAAAYCVVSITAAYCAGTTTTTAASATAAAA